MITERTKAILLFTSYLSKETDKVNKPLSLTEWNKLVRWLQSKEAYPEAFLSESAYALLNSWNDQSISRGRLASLLERKASLALALDKWTRAGVWVVSRGDAIYPKLLKDRLKGSAPNILFGIGDQSLLNHRFIGVVGSRNAVDIDIEISKSIGRQVYERNMGIVSGGAKGIDEAAMIGALEAGGICVGFLADSLIKKSTSSNLRNYIIKNKLILITPFNPEAGFNAGNAMGRNKLIYALAEASIVVISDIKGGTWEGAKENIKNNWSPIWVCPSEENGNKEIVKMGGHWLPDIQNIDVSHLGNHAKLESNLFSSTTETNNQISSSSSTNIVLQKDDSDKIFGNDYSVQFSQMTNFDFFVFKWFEYFGNFPITKSEISEKLNVTLKQVELWLELAVQKDIAIKLKSKTSVSWNLNKVIKVLFD